MKRNNFFRSDQPSVNRYYNGYKRQNTNGNGGGGWKKRDDSDNPPTWGKYNGFNQQEDKVSPAEFASMKEKHGTMIALLIGADRTIYKLKQSIQKGSPETKLILKKLEDQRKLIIDARPNATKYIHLSFYTGLRIGSTTEDPQTGKYESELTYQGGAQMVKTHIVHNEGELDRYCMQIDEILSHIQTVNDLQQDETLADIKKQIEALVEEDNADDANAKQQKVESGNEADGEDEDEQVLVKDTVVTLKLQSPIPKEKPVSAFV